jgi:hypothetical protein
MVPHSSSTFFFHRFTLAHNQNLMCCSTTGAESGAFGPIPDPTGEKLDLAPKPDLNPL